MGMKPPGAYDEETLDAVIERGCDHSALEEEAELQQRAAQELQSGVDEENAYELAPLPSPSLHPNQGTNLG